MKDKFVTFLPMDIYELLKLPNLKKQDVKPLIYWRSFNILVSFYFLLYLLFQRK